MQDTLRCPGCAAELTLPGANATDSMQCPRCLHVFDAQTTTSTAIAPSPELRRNGLADCEAVTTTLPPTPRLKKPIAPPGRWFTVAFILVLAANAALLSLFGFEFMQREGFVPRDPNFQITDIVNLVATMSPSVTLLIFVTWCIVAGQSASRLHVTGLWTPSTLFVWLIFCPAAPVIAYVHLQHLWKSSDPLSIHEPEAWRNVPASWAIRALALLSVFIAVGTAFGSIFDDQRRRINSWLGLLILASMLAACILMLTIVYRIGQRQQQRYIHLYEDPP